MAVPAAAPFVDPLDIFGLEPDTPPPVEDPDAKSERKEAKDGDDEKEKKEGEESADDTDGEYEEEMDPEEPAHIARWLRRTVNKPRFSNIEIIVGEEKERFYANKAVLAARSPFFHAMFYNTRWVEATASEIVIDDLSPSTFRTLLHVMYTDHCVLDPSTVIEVLFAAKKYQVKKLIKKCTRYMQKGVGVENACILFETTSALLEEEQVVLKFIEDNTEECVTSEGFLQLSPENLLLICRSEFITIQEIDLFRACVKWAEMQVVKEQSAAYAARPAGTELKAMSLEGRTEAKKALLREILPHIRFPTMTMEEFSSAVPASGVLPPADMLKLFTLLGKRRDETKAPVREPYHCAACTFFNTGDKDTCTMCQTPAPAPGSTVVYHDWLCPVCTFENRAMRPKCEMCTTDRPEPKKEEKKAAAKKAGELVYLDEPRTPRRADHTRMRFLICGADTDANCQDVRTSILNAYSGKAGYKPSKFFTVDIHCFATTATAPSLETLKRYDAIFTWSASQVYPEPFCDNCAAYIDAGGGVIVGAIATNPGTYGMAGRFERENYSSIVRGAQMGGTFNPVIPTDAKELRHPVFRNVTTFNGGSGSYRSNVTLTPGAKALALWSDRTPLVVEKEGPRKPGGRVGLSMCLNWYPVSSRIQEQYWTHSTDGGLLMLNSLIYCGQKGNLQRAKVPTSSSSR